jgi:hypothetical protein
MIVVIFVRLFFYMSTFQVQLQMLLIPRGSNEIHPEDFRYSTNEEGHFDSGNNPRRSSAAVSSIASYWLTYIPFYNDQTVGTESNLVSLRQFTFNPRQPQIFISDLQEMMYILIPLASLISIFWIITLTSDYYISSSLLIVISGLLIWGIFQ